MYGLWGLGGEGVVLGGVGLGGVFLGGVGLVVGGVGLGGGVFLGGVGLGGEVGLVVGGVAFGGDGGVVLGEGGGVLGEGGGVLGEGGGVLGEVREVLVLRDGNGVPDIGRGVVFSTGEGVVLGGLTLDEDKVVRLKGTREVRVTLDDPEDSESSFGGTELPIGTCETADEETHSVIYSGQPQ